MADRRLSPAEGGEHRLAATPGASWRLGAGVLAACCAAAPLAATLAWNPPVLLLFNASASVPRGLYRVVPGSLVRRGEMVVAWPPAKARELASGRRYLPSNVPLVKRVAAAGGDRVCALGGRISVNGRNVAVLRRSDSAGRAMPSWTGCRLLGPGMVFLLGEGANSFDGRYFGVTEGSGIVGRAVLLWRA